MFFIISLLACIHVCMGNHFTTLSIANDDNRVPMGTMQIPITKFELDVCYYDATKHRDVCTQFYSPTLPDPMAFEAHAYEQPSSYYLSNRRAGEFDASATDRKDEHDEDLLRYGSNPTHIVNYHISPPPESSQPWHGEYYPSEFGNPHHHPQTNQGQSSMNMPQYNQPNQGQSSMNMPQYNQPGYGQGAPSPPYNQGPPSPPYNQGPLSPPYNQGPPSPPYNQGPPSPPYNQGPPSPPYNQGPPMPGPGQGPQGYGQVPPPTGYLQMSPGLNQPTYGQEPSIQIVQPSENEYIYVDTQMMEEDDDNNNNIIEYEYFDTDEYIYAVPKNTVKKLVKKKPELSYINTLLGLKK